MGDAGGEIELDQNIRRIAGDAMFTKINWDISISHLEIPRASVRR
jgi:hypothetical protein